MPDKDRHSSDDHVLRIGGSQHMVTLNEQIDIAAPYERMRCLQDRAAGGSDVPDAAHVRDGDYPTIEYKGGKLIRTKTLGAGDDCCDFHVVKK